MAAQFVVVGISPFHDTSVAVGPFRSAAKIAEAESDLTHKGWNTETIELSRLDEISIVANDEGA
jgi:hypothetical protein